MAASFRIVTDSTADLPAAWRERYGIGVVPLKTLFGNETFRDGVDLTSEQFFQRLAAGSTLPTTSAPSPGDFAECYQRMKDEGARQVISIHIGANLSGTAEAARVGAQQVEGLQVEVVDSGSVSFAIAFLCRAAAEQETFEAALAAVRERTEKAVVLALLDTLRYVQMGGRISRIQYLLGSWLDVKPILRLSEGEIKPAERARTRGRAIPLLLDLFRRDLPVESLAVVHAQAPDEAARVREQLQAELPEVEIESGEIGSVLGTHTGPRALGLIYLRR